MSKIYVFDLDGTLCNTPSREKDQEFTDYTKAVPIMYRIEIVNRIYEKGNIIIIDTARGSNSGKSWFNHTIRQMNGWGLKFHTLRTGVKFNADYYIDDKSVVIDKFFNERDGTERRK